ncbi:MAG: class I SAM-dependent methyltransferase [bacterium]
MTQWYKELFKNYSASYDKESFTQGTLGECDFIEKELDYDKTKTILDVGCGTGRHAVELAKRGYKITGIDLSEDQLNRARQKAKDANVEVKFLQADARNFKFDEKFDFAMMMCEGAFSLMETDEMNFQILECINNTLKSPAKLIFTCLNALFPLYHSTKEFMEKEGQEIKESTFDLMTLRDDITFVTPDDDGNPRTFTSNERYYMPSEISWMLKSLGFKQVDILGAPLGAFSRGVNLTANDFEMLVVAEK